MKHGKNDAIAIVLGKMKEKMGKKKKEKSPKEENDYHSDMMEEGVTYFQAVTDAKDPEEKMIAFKDFHMWMHRYDEEYPTEYDEED